MSLKSDTKVGNCKILFTQYFKPKNLLTANPERVKATKCIIKENGQLVSEGEVTLNHKDVDNKQIARKFALKQAISNIPNKEFRTQIWNALRNR